MEIDHLNTIIDSSHQAKAGSEESIRVLNNRIQQLEIQNRKQMDENLEVLNENRYLQI